MGCTSNEDGTIHVCSGYSEWYGPPEYQWLTKREREMLELVEELGRIPLSGIPGPLKRRICARQWGPWAAPLLYDFGPDWVLTDRGRQVLEIERSGKAEYDIESNRWMPVKEKAA